jgi:hypothetical protein
MVQKYGAFQNMAIAFFIMQIKSIIRAIIMNTEHFCILHDTCYIKEGRPWDISLFFQEHM